MSENNHLKGIPHTEKTKQKIKKTLIETNKKNPELRFHKSKTLKGLDSIMRRVEIHRLMEYKKKEEGDETNRVETID